MAAFPPIAHVAVTVTDLAASTRWYAALLGSEPVLDEDAHYGSGVSFRDPDGVALEFFAPPGG